jgi:hypothetical protein
MFKVPDEEWEHYVEPRMRRYTRLHKITGTMAVHWTRASTSDLAQWASELRAIAAAMEAASTGGQPCGEAVAAAKASDVITRLVARSY